jgi:hypothetical protein
MNIFIEYIQSEKIKTKEELKRFFWILAKRTHPDVSEFENNEKTFIQLKNQYDEALVLLKSHKKDEKHKVYTKIDFIDVFSDLVALNFPVDKSIIKSLKAYEKRIDVMSEIIRSIGIQEIKDFRDVENELYEIRGDNIVQNRLFGIIKMLFYSLISYYYEPVKFSKNAIEKWFLEIEDELQKKNFTNLFYFLKWIVSDLNNRTT